MNATARTVNRRRLTIAALLLVVLVSLVSWWCWPRGDARLVGKWQDARNEGGVFDFRRNGVVYWGDQPGVRSMWTHWKVERDVVYFGQPINQLKPHPLRHAYAAWEWLTGQAWLQTGLSPMRVLEVSRDQLRLWEIDEETGEGSDVYFKRLSE